MVILTKWDISNNDGRHPLGLLLRVCTFESRVPLLSNPRDMPVAWDLVSRYYVAGGGGVWQRWRGNQRQTTQTQRWQKWLQQQQEEVVVEEEDICNNNMILMASSGGGRQKSAGEDDDYHGDRTKEVIDGNGYVCVCANLSSG